MDSPVLSFVFQQLLYQVPLLLATLLGVVLSLVFWKRSPGPAAITLIASVAMLLTAVAVTGLQGYLLSLRLERGWSNADYARWNTVVGLISATVRGLGTAAVVAAVFIGRPRV